MDRTIANVMIHCTEQGELIAAKSVLQQKGYEYDIHREEMSIELYETLTIHELSDLIDEIENYNRQLIKASSAMLARFNKSTHI